MHHREKQSVLVGETNIKYQNRYSNTGAQESIRTLEEAV